MRTMRRVMTMTCQCPCYILSCDMLWRILNVKLNPIPKARCLFRAGYICNNMVLLLGIWVQVRSFLPSTDTSGIRTAVLRNTRNALWQENLKKPRGATWYAGKVWQIMYLRTRHFFHLREILQKAHFTLLVFQHPHLKSWMRSFLKCFDLTKSRSWYVDVCSVASVTYTLSYIIYILPYITHTNISNIELPASFDSLRPCTT